MGSGTLISVILVVAAAAVLMIYRLEVLRDVFSGFGRKQKQKSMDLHLQRGLGRASDLRAEHERLAKEAKRRLQPLLLETIRAVEAPSGTVTVLARNLGGFATDVHATSTRSTVHITPPTIEPDGEVQLTFMEVGGAAPGGAAPDIDSSKIDARLEYVSAYGQPDHIAIAYVRATQEIEST